MSTTSWVLWTVSASFTQHLLASDLGPALRRDQGHSSVWEEGPVWCTQCYASDARGEGLPGPSSCPRTPLLPSPRGRSFPLGPRGAVALDGVGCWVYSPQAVCGLGEALPSFLISKMGELASTPGETGVTSTRLESDRRHGDHPGLQIQAPTLTLDPGFQSKHS